MTAVLLALTSAALFGVMTVTVRVALAHGAAAEAATLYTLVPALVVTLVAAAAEGGWRLGAVWPFLRAGSCSSASATGRST